VSPSWLRRLEVALSPAGAAWACGAARGRCEGEPAAAFAAALAAAPRARRVAVTLCGSLVHCLLVPWPAEIEDEAEGEALAGHHFRRVFGEQAAAWAIRVDAEEGAARLAFAAPRGLLEALRAGAAAASRRLVSVQPFLAASFNLWRREFGRAGALYVTLEPGRWCAALVAGGEWRAVRSGRLEGDAASALVELVARETALAGDPALPARVYAPAFQALADQVQGLGGQVRLLRRAEEPLHAAAAH
jgi:hypothetical protein